MIKLNISLCEDIIDAKAGFWREASTIYNKYSKRAKIASLCAQLHDVLICEHSPQKGTDVLREITSIISRTNKADAYLFCAGALGCLVPEAMKHYYLIGELYDVAKASIGDMSRWIENYGIAHGSAFGVDEFTWIVRAFAGTLFEIGSLQYEVSTFALPYYIYDYTADGKNKIYIMPQAGLEVCADGYICGTNGTHLSAAFTTQMYEKEGKLYANAIDMDNGLILPDMYSVDTDPLRPLVTYGTPVLNIHIPRGADLSCESVDASIKAAKKHFAHRHYPHEVFVCNSWMLDITLKKWLTSDSKIIALADRFMRLAKCNDSYSGGRFVFSTDFTMDKIKSAVPKSRLAQEMRDYMINGGEMFDTAGIALL